MDVREINYGLDHSACKEVFVMERIRKCYGPDTHIKEFTTLAYHPEWEWLSRCSDYVIATGRFGVRIPPEKNTFLYIPKTSRPALGPTQLFIHWVLGLFSRRIASRPAMGPTQLLIHWVLGLFPRHIVSRPAMGPTQLLIHCVLGLFLRSIDSRPAMGPTQLHIH